MNPFAVFEELEEVAAYRRPDRIHDTWSQVEAAQAELRARFDASTSDRERLDIVVEVAGRLISLARRRSSTCQLKHQTLACENLDIEEILAQWLEFVQGRLEAPSASRHR